MKNICLVNGSLRGAKAASLQFLNDLDLKLNRADFSKTVLTVKAKIKDRYPEDMLKSLADADAIVFIFPLHNYGIPGALFRLLEDFYRYTKTGHSYNKDAKIYMIVNCGFARPIVNTEAIRVMNNFCRRLAFNWRFAVCIGTGPVVMLERKIPFLHSKLKKAFSNIVADILSGNDQPAENCFIKPVIPAPVLIKIKNYYEKKGQLIEKPFPK
jgi:putative NADPH-quinone reductase